MRRRVFAIMLALGVTAAIPSYASVFCADCEYLRFGMWGQEAICRASVDPGIHGTECVINPDQTCYTIGRCQFDVV